MSTPNTDTGAPKGLSAANALTILLAAAAAFFLLTQGIPFAQLGLIEDIPKSLAIRSMRFSVALFAASLVLVRFLLPALWERLWITKAVRAWTARPLRPSLLFVYAVYCAILIGVNLWRHQAFGTRAFDLGIFSQALWTTLHGDFLCSSLKGGICLLGDHVSPLLAALAPLYALWPDPRLLIILQVLVSGLNFFFVAHMAKEKLKDPLLVWVMVLIYFFYQPTRNALHEDFHPEKLVEPLIFAAFIFLEKRRLIPFLLCLPVIAAAKENMLGVTFILGFYAFVFKRLRFTGAAVMILSLGIFWLELKWFVPWLTGKPYFYQEVYTRLSSPLGFLQVLMSVDSLEYIAKIFGPFLFLSFFHPPVLLLTFPILFQNLLAGNPLARSIGYHYTIGMTPFIFAGTIYGWVTLCEKVPFLRNRKTVIGVLLLVMAIMQSGASEYYAFWQNQKLINANTAHFKSIRPVLEAIPPEFSVLTHNNFVPVVSNRKHVHMFEFSEVVMKKQQIEQWQPDKVVFDERFWETGGEPLPQFIEDLKASGYEAEDEKDGFYVYKKGPKPLS
jgi:uncharacterized membrane protein